MKISPKWSPLRISIVTPVLPSASDYLQECEESINELTYTLGYCGIIVQWLVCIDGPGELAHKPLADHVVRLSSKQGPAKARNALLALAKGDWVIPLDCDDKFDLNGMTALGQFLIDDADDIGWFAGNRLLMCGERTPHWNNTGRVYAPGDLSQQWTSPFPFHPNSMAVRRSVLVGLGGWPELPVNEDMALALLLSEHSQGRVHTHIMTRYRVWSKQAVAQPQYTTEKQKAFQVIEGMINSHREALGRAPVSAPQAGSAYGISGLARSA